MESRPLPAVVEGDHGDMGGVWGRDVSKVKKEREREREREGERERGGRKLKD